ncbi:helix-turn-helix transcriptional regulator [Clostridium sp. P21]|uniref:Helix-turn-helix transcriptional regulator n=1 Tax=Clostridium muellerianum TaxID=2716538 RepID=A0A7Y0EET8_9CLOT|nr:helix-turn-helix transcriptional regulator [Clostridium muellerianum]NMM62063.1 helix-turn-helix transcriptional regulator [Clostridium muellerianum]
MNLKEIRKQKGFTVANLAEAIGVSASYIYQLEKEVKNPSKVIMQKISKVLETSVQELFF